MESSRMTGIKKDVGVKFLRAYLYHQAFALPLHEDKQRKVRPRRVIEKNPLRPETPRHTYTKTHSTEEELHLIYIYKGENRTWGIKKFTHANASVALPLHEESKLRSLMIQAVTSENVLSRLAVQLA
jgi:hypothetical protein